MRAALRGARGVASRAPAAGSRVRGAVWRRAASGSVADSAVADAEVWKHAGRAAVDGHYRMERVEYYEGEGGETGLAVFWEDGTESRFESTWLRLCGADCFHETTQRLVNAQDLAVFPSVMLTSLFDGEANTVTMTWKEADSTEQSTTTVSGEFLRKSGFRARPKETFAPATVRRGKEAVVRLSWADVQNDDSALYTLMKGVCDDGLAILTGVPDREKAVLDVAGRISPVQDTLYGSFFDVESMPDPINIAYTGERLAYHMDLAYYDSPPGIQCLHCRSFSDSVEGGESTFLDAHAAAERFRERHPEHFATLCRVPAKFQKDHLDREHPAQFFFERPHIATHSRTGEVIAVFWSPPFEGMLAAPHADVLPYYAAYRAFAKFVEAPETSDGHGFRFRLAEGEEVLFNNRRLLHGRESFLLNGGHRHLQGCYLSLDDFINKFRNLSLAYGEPSYLLPRMGIVDQA